MIFSSDVFQAAQVVSADRLFWTTVATEKNVEKNACLAARSQNFVLFFSFSARIEPVDATSGIRGIGFLAGGVKKM